MGDLTRNISRHELKCKCGDCDVYIQDHEPIIDMWQGACDFFAKKYKVLKVGLDITSAARCYRYNRTPIDQDGPGSNDNSQHPRCTAIDGKIFINATQIKPSEVADYFEDKNPYSCGIGRYNSFTHVDSRPIKSRWGK